MITQNSLENNRVLLEPLDLRHLKLLLPQALNHPELLKYSPVPFGDEEKLKAYFQKAFDETEQHKRWAFAVFDKSKNQFAGSSSFILISEPSKVMEIGSTWIGEEFQGTGLNANMKYVMLKHLFEDLNYERVEFKTDERNKASRKALEKLGAKFEGTLREHIQMLDGFRRSSAVYGILRSEWPNVKESILSK